jgi:hypothetical protein
MAQEPRKRSSGESPVVHSQRGLSLIITCFRQLPAHTDG